MHALDSFSEFLSFVLRELLQKRAFAFEIVHDTCNHSGGLQLLLWVKEIHLWGVLNMEARVKPIRVLQSSGGGVRC